MTMSGVRGTLEEVVTAEARQGSALLTEYLPDAPRLLTIRNTTTWYPISSHVTAGVEILVAGTIFDLEILSRRFSLSPTATPAAIVGEAYQRHGAGFLDLVVGRFAVLIADRRARRLLAVRDQMGVFPLFYARSRRGLLFSTSTSLLADEPEVSRAPNRLVIAEHLAHRFLDANETYFANIRRVPPGHVLDVTADGERLSRYWDPGSHGMFESMSDDEAVERFNAAFRVAVSRCLGTSRTGVLLSGGFDSVSVAATAASLLREQGREPLHALSVGFPDPGCDEQNVQRGVARTLGLTQELLPMAEALGGRGLLESSLDMGVDWPTPMMNLWAPAYRELVQRGARIGCETVLGGTGGDEWLNVSPSISADLMRAGKFGELFRLYRVFNRSFKINALTVARNVFWTFGLRRLVGASIAAVAPNAWQSNRHQREIAKTPPWVAPDPELRRAMDERAASLVPAARPERGYYDRDLQVSLTHPLMAIEYEEAFEFGRRCGTRMLSPYLDPDLVRVLYRMPPIALTAGGRSKGLVRSAVSRLFPELGFERQRKVNATGYFRSVMAAEGPREWKRRRGAQSLARLGVLDTARFDQKLGELFEGRDSEHNYIIWDTLNVGGWVETNTSTL